MTAASKRRKKLPVAVETQILTESRRRCCLCFHFDNDTTQKDGQIAHIDHQRTNNVESNLVFLCLVHHNCYDSEPSQSKGITASELRHAKQSLYTVLKNNGGSDRVVLRITVEVDYDEVSPEDHKSILEKILALSDAKREINIRSISRGSIRYNIDVDAEDAALICKAFNNGVLTSSGVVDVRFAPPESREITFVDEFERMSFGTSRQQVIDVVTHADSTLTFPGITESSRDPISVRLFLKRYTEKYSILVLGSGDLEVVVALPLNHRFVDPPVGANPLDVLKKFLDEFGVALDTGGNGPLLRLSERISLPFNCNQLSDVGAHFERVAIAAGHHNHSLVMFADMSLFDPRGLIVHVLFMIALDKYAMSLNELGRKLPKCVFRNIRAAKRKK